MLTVSIKLRKYDASVTKVFYYYLSQLSFNSIAFCDYHAQITLDPRRFPRKTFTGRWNWVLTDRVRQRPPWIWYKSDSWMISGAIWLAPAALKYWRHKLLSLESLRRCVCCRLWVEAGCSGSWWVPQSDRKRWYPYRSSSSSRWRCANRIHPWCSSASSSSTSSSAATTTVVSYRQRE